MSEMNPKVDHILAIGCGRCKLVGTPRCKVNDWRVELAMLREILLESPLAEEVKWGMPCYTWEGKNVLMLAVFRDYCSLGFFKGALLKDPKGVLVFAGENSQAAKMFRFTSAQAILKSRKTILAYIEEAVELEKSGRKVEFRKSDAHAVPTELEERFRDLPEFKKAFHALTPGRQRGYLIFFSAPKKSETRVSRIEKFRPSIMQGKGMQD